MRKNSYFFQNLMKIVISGFLLMLGLILPPKSFSQTVNATFQVNMNLEILLGQFNPATDFVDVAGSFNSWGGTVMADPELDGIYSVNLIGVLSVGTSVEFKFRKNGNWNTSEFPGGGANRTYTPVAGNNDQLFYYNMLNPVTNVTFTVIDGTQSYTDIEFKGNNTGWNLAQMYDNGTHGDLVSGDHTWTVILPVGQGTTEWGAIQNDGSQWGIWLISGPNPQVTVNASGTASGQTSYTIPPPGNIPLTLSVNMNLQEAIGAFDPVNDIVDVAGSFNNWSGTQLTDTDGDGIYTLTIQNLTLGATYYFKFRINADWGLAEFPGGGPNREYTIVTGTNSVNYWFNDQELGSPVDVTFTLTDLPATNLDVRLKGSFNAWTLVPMYDNGTNGDLVANDHIWSLTLSVIPGTWEWGCVEFDGSPDGIWLLTGPNPTFTVSETGTQSGQTSYTIPIPITFNQMFTVEDGTGAYLDIEMKGSFNSWALAQMYDDGTNGDVFAGDHVWTVILPVPVGSWTWNAIENDGSLSGIDLITGTDPEFSIDLLGVVTGTVNYEILPPNYTDVTFNVNMNYQISLGNFNPLTDFVDVAGSFSGYSGVVMADTDGDGIYSVSIADLTIGDTQLFKFRLNANWNTAELFGFPDRQYIVIDGVNEPLYWYNNQEPASLYPVLFTLIDQPGTMLDVELKGSFNAWTLEQMYDDGTHGDLVAGDHSWSLELMVPVGSWEWGAIENDGSQWGIWLIQGANPAFSVDVLGAVTGQTSYTIPLVINYQDVTLNVDMNHQILLGYFNPLSDVVDVAGSFNSWSGTILSDIDGDGIYSIVMQQLTEGTAYQFKFRINSDWMNSEFPGGGTNREITVSDGVLSYSYTYNDELSIHAIQYTTQPSGDSPFAGSAYGTRGIVSGIAANGFFIQWIQGEWNGLFVNTISFLPAQGDMVFVRGTIEENAGQTTIGNLSSWSVVTSGNSVPSPVIGTTLAFSNTEAYEGVLVRVLAANCTNASAGNGEWTVNDGSGPLNVDDYMFAYSPVAANHYNITGNLMCTSSLKLAPRYLADITDTVTTQTQNINLNAGWSLISTYISPTNPLISHVFAPVVAQLRIVKNGSGQIYWPQFSINSIGSLVIGQGYQVNMVSAQVLAVVGQVIDPITNPLYLNSGWNMIGYLRTSAGAISSMVSTITGSFNIMKNGQGQVYWPVFGINTIGNMQPGAGYQISMKFAATLTFPANSANIEKADFQPTPLFHFGDVKPSDCNLILCIPNNLLIHIAEQGSELGIFSADGTLAGCATFDGNNVAIAIWGDDKLSSEKDGLTETESFYLSVFNSLSTEIQSFEIQFNGGEKAYYASNSFKVAESLNPKTMVNISVFPNPVSNNNKLYYFAQEVASTDLKLLNSLGQELQSFNNFVVECGQNEIPFELSALKPGVYFLNICNPTQNHNFRIVVND